MITIDATTWLILEGLAIVGLVLAVARLEFKVWKLENPRGPARSIREECEEQTIDPLFAAGAGYAYPPKPDPTPPPPRPDLGVPGGSPGDAAELRAVGRGGFPPPRGGYQPDGDGVPVDPGRPPRGGSGAQKPAPMENIIIPEGGSPRRASDHTGGGRR